MSPPAILRDRLAYRTSDLLIIPHVRDSTRAYAREFFTKKRSYISVTPLFTMSTPAILRDRLAYRTSDLLIIPHVRDSTS